MAGVVDRLMYPIIRAFSSRMAKFARQAFSMIRYRLGSFWWVVLRNFWRQKQNDALSPPPQIKEPLWVGTKIKEESGPYLQESSIPTCAFVEKGDIISMDSTLAFSLYPSSGGMNNALYLAHDAILSSPNDDSALGSSPPNGVSAEQYSNNIAMGVLDVEVKISFANIRIKPVMPEATQRYERRSTISNDETTMAIEPLSLSFHEFLPSGWVKHIHPEGARYFYNQEKKVYTDADILDSQIFKFTTDNLAQIECFLLENDISLPDTSILVIDSYYQEDGSIQSTYYYLDTVSRVIFFLDVYQADDLLTWQEVPGIKSNAHLRQELEAQYWYHVSLYPHTLELSPPIICELRDMVLHFIGDTMTSAVATSPYTVEDLQRILKTVNTLEKSLNHHSVGAVSLLSRFMYIFYHTRFYNFHGEPQARLERDQSVYGHSPNQKTRLIKIFSYLLFSMPDAHLRNLQKMQVDKILYKYDWDRTVEAMKDEWAKLTLVATCFIFALGVNSPNSYRTPVQILGYLTTFCCFGTIILGLLLLYQHREAIQMNAQNVQQFLEKNNGTSFGLEPLAILYSLPYGLLMWGLLLFLVGLCIRCIQSPSVLTPVVVGPICASLGMVIFWLSPYWPSKWSVDRDNTPESDSRELQNYEMNTKPKPFWRLANLFSIPRRSWYSEKTAV